MIRYTSIGPAVAALILFGCGSGDSTQGSAHSAQPPTQTTPTPSMTAAPEPEPPTDSLKVVTDTTLLNTLIKHNDAAFIPAQCYTKTQSERGEVFNPCYACHQASKEPNYLDDGDLQLEYALKPVTLKNRWSNLFKDRTDAVAAISDAEILSWVRTSNYFSADGNILLAERLADVPANWDFNGDNSWGGYRPDCYFNFDEQGFDRDPQGKDTGWRAFTYTPFLGTFWPTNGSTDDVLIRLAPALRQDADGNDSRDVYTLNLAIVEAMIKRTNVAIVPTDERLYQVDLNRNGKIDVASHVVYDWEPRQGRDMHYVGKAYELQQQGALHIAGGLYPEGTEFLHTVRYIDVTDSGTVAMAPRIKELRYSYKTNWNTYSQLNNVALAELREADAFPERLRNVKGDPEHGVLNGLSWLYQGFIEDKNGDLRPQSYEESVNCVGCHSGIGATTDSSFAFARRVSGSGPNDGWSHWSQRGLTGIAEPQWRDGTWEYTEYLKQNKWANEFRTNEEVIAKFFDQNGDLKAAQVEALHSDIGELLLPSASRALALNKAYKVIVDEQSYVLGRDAHVAPLANVWQEVPEGELTGVAEAVVLP